MAIVCLGDSNTYGYDPRLGSAGRYPKENRWVDLLEGLWGETLVNEGENGRLVPEEGFFLKSFESAERIFILLGSNDILMGRSAGETGLRMERFLKALPLERERILLLSPSEFRPGEWVWKETWITASRELRKVYGELSQSLHIPFLDTGAWEIPLSFDGVHFTEEGHRIFARKLYENLKKEKEQYA